MDEVRGNILAYSIKYNFNINEKILWEMGILVGKFNSETLEENDMVIKFNW